MTSLITAPYNWLRRKMRLPVVLAVVAGGGVGAYFGVRRLMVEARKLNDSLTRQLTEELQTQLISQQLSGEHFKRVLADSSSSTHQLLLASHPRLEELVDVQALVRNLRKLTREDADWGAHWARMKVEAFTRLICSVYMVALLSVLVHVQLAALGRRSFEHMVEEKKRRRPSSPPAPASASDAAGAAAAAPAAAPAAAADASTADTAASLASSAAADGTAVALTAASSASDSPGLHRATRTAMLTCLWDHALNAGLQQLVQAVRAATEQALEGVGLQDRVAPATLSRLVVSVRRCVEGELAYQEVAAAERVPPGQHVLAASPLLDTLLPPEEAVRAMTDPVARELAEEVMDVLESPFFTVAMRATLDDAFAAAVDRLVAASLAAASAPPAAAATAAAAAGGGPRTSPPAPLSPPLANLLPKLRPLADSFVSGSRDAAGGGSNALEQVVCRAPSLREVAELVYGLDAAQEEVPEADLAALMGGLGSPAATAARGAAAADSSRGSAPRS